MTIIRLPLNIFFIDYEITNCGVKGRDGPTQTDCNTAYKNTSVKVKVMHAPGLNGIQKWTVPHDGYYT